MTEKFEALGKLVRCEHAVRLLHHVWSEVDVAVTEIVAYVLDLFNLAIGRVHISAESVPMQDVLTLGCNLIVSLPSESNQSLCSFVFDHFTDSKVILSIIGISQQLVFSSVFIFVFSVPMLDAVSNVLTVIDISHLGRLLILLRSDFVLRGRVGEDSIFLIPID